MNKRQTPLVAVNVMNLVLFVIGVAVIMYTDQVEEQCLASVELPTGSDDMPISVIRSERELVTHAFEALLESATEDEHAEEILMIPALTCDAPATISSEPAARDHEILLVGFDLGNAVVPKEESESCEDNSMIRCEQQEARKVRAEYDASARACEPVEQGERSFGVPVLFAMLAGVVMNCSLVTSLPGLI